jgi:hypothetical protein
VTADRTFEPAPLEDIRWSKEGLLDALKDEMPLPREIARVAAIYVSEIAPDIIRLLERARVEQLEAASECLLFRGVHVLGPARVKAAYRPLMAFLHAPEDRIEHLLGDASTETLPKILAGVFDGDAEPLLALIEDDKVHEWVRDAALRTVAFLAFDGRLDQSAAGEFLARFEQRSTAPAGDAAWHGWMTAVALLGLNQLSPRVHAAFEDGRLSPEFADEGDYRMLLTDALTRPTDPARFEAEHLGYIEDIAATLAWFGTEDPDGFDDGDGDWASHTPVRNPWRDVGRNDPCPCGSGKKFKKCCLPDLV